MTMSTTTRRVICHVRFVPSVVGIVVHLRVGKTKLVTTVTDHPEYGVVEDTQDTNLLYGRRVPQEVRDALMMESMETAPGMSRITYDSIREAFPEARGADYRTCIEVYRKAVAGYSETLSIHKDKYARGESKAFTARIRLVLPPLPRKRRKGRPTDMHNVQELAAQHTYGFGTPEPSDFDDICASKGSVEAANAYLDKLAAGALSRSIFKYTECGCSFYHDPAGEYVSVSGYVEGYDGELPSHRLYFPFAYSRFLKALGEADKEGCDVWNDTHGCEDCGEEDPYTGYRPVNPNCKTCNGEGQIL